MKPTSPQARMRALLTDGLTAMDVAEHLVAFDDDRGVTDVREFLDIRRLRIAGIRQFGAVVGFVWRRELRDGTLADHVHPMEDDQVVSDTTRLAEVIRRLKNFEYCFVEVLGVVTGIVSRSDIEKPPARMWLFGMITVLEMYMVRAIDEQHPGDAWTSLISEGRLRKAQELREERHRRKQHAKLLDCLQLGDKADIFLRDPTLFASSAFESVGAGQRAVKRLGSLRNNLAHAQDIVTHDWPAIVEIAEASDRIVTRI